jgi:hypothetical protein
MAMAAVSNRLGSGTKRAEQTPYCYTLAGLGLASELELPELAPLAAPPAVDVTLAYGAVPMHLEQARYAAGGIEVAGDDCLLTVPGVARYLARGGCEIEVEPLAGAAARDVRLFLLGSVLGAVCCQRRLLPLHASAVRVGDGCAAFVGGSGAGKSTLAAYLQRRGYTLLCDDVLVLERGGNGLTARAGIPRLKLWEDGLMALAREIRGLARVRAGVSKYEVPVVESVFQRQPLRLDWVYSLQFGDGESPITAPLMGLEALASLMSNTYRPALVRAMGLQAWQFGFFTDMGAGAARIRRLLRPRGLQAMDRVIDALERDWEDGAGKNEAVSVREGIS